MRFEKTFDGEKFRREFKTLDDSVLLGIEHMAALMSRSVAAVYTMRSRGLLPRPAVNGPKSIYWTAGQWRAWSAALSQAAAAEPGPAAPRARVGRPRLTSEATE